MMNGMILQISRQLKNNAIVEIDTDKFESSYFKSLNFTDISYFKDEDRFQDKLKNNAEFFFTSIIEINSNKELDVSIDRLNSFVCEEQNPYIDNNLFLSRINSFSFKNDSDKKTDQSNNMDSLTEKEIKEVKYDQMMRRMRDKLKNGIGKITLKNGPRNPKSKNQSNRTSEMFVEGVLGGIQEDENKKRCKKL